MNQNQYHLSLIHARHLIDKPLHPPDFVVDTLLSKGLHILAGLPKVGKSWLALWLAVTVAKGEPLWNMRTRPGTVLYLSLEDTEVRIQNRLLQVTEDVPEGLHFCIESHVLGKGLEQELENYLADYPDAVLVIIDTLQMVRGTGYDNTYANDYRDLGILKRIADTHGIAILLIHHLRKEVTEDVFCRISGTTGISGAVDSSFTLVEERRGSGRATLSCIGRDIGFRELTLARNEDNVWELVSDSLGPPDDLGDRMVRLLRAAMEGRSELIGTPTELAEHIGTVTGEAISPKKISREVLQSVGALREAGIAATCRRSNGKRLIELRRADSDGDPGAGNIDPIDPAAAQQARCSPA